MFDKLAKSLILTSTFALLTFLGTAQTATVQFIHNSPDPSVETIDVWLNDSLWANDVDFLHATPFLLVDTSSFSNFEIRHALDSAILFFSWNAALTANSKHIFVLHGQLNPQEYSPSEPLDVAHFPQALEQSASSSSIDVLFFQGVSEIDTADVAESQLFQLTAFDQLPYGEFSSYINLFTADYGWSILNSEGNTTYGEYVLPVGDLNWAGKAITIVAGGFINQSDNNNGQPLGMWATTREGGQLIPLSPLQWNLDARVQFLHNSNLPGAGNIRIETDEVTWQTNLNLHEATPFQSFPAGKDVVITFRSNLLGSPIDSIWSDTLHLFSGAEYQLIWYGGDDAENAARLHVQEWETTPDLSEDSMLLRLFNGSESYSPITLLADTVSLLPVFENIEYGFMSDTLTVAVMNEEWILFTENDSITAYQAPLDTLGYQQHSVTALTYTTHETALPELWLSTEDGGPMHQLNSLIIPEPPVFCTIQLVHTSADTLLNTIHVWINDSLVAQPLPFESATAFLSVRCNDPIVIRLARHDNPTTILHIDTIQVAPNQTHRLILWGILETAHYNPAPELNWYLDSNISLSSSSADAFDVRFFHAATDLGDVQINEASTPIVPFFITTENGEMSAVQSLPAQNDYGVELLNTPTQFVYGTFALPSNTWQWENESITLLSTGFRQPANNSNGETLELWALEPNGSMTVLGNFVHISMLNDQEELLLFPNPASQKIRVQATCKQVGIAGIEIINNLGEVIQRRETIIRNGEIDEEISLDSLPNGTYAIMIKMNAEKRTSRFCVVR